MAKPTYNEKGEATNCFAYSPKQIKKAECSIMRRGKWYNDTGKRCLKCPFFKVSKESKT